MQPKSVHTTGEPAALLVRAADLLMIMEKLNRISETLAEVQSALPLKRRKISRETRRAHIGCVQGWYDGKCPCCRETRIVDEKGHVIQGCNEEHFVNRHENSIDKTWLVCQDCNQRKTTGKLAHADVEALFRAYQVTLRKHLAGETEGPYQMKMSDSKRVATFTKAGRYRKARVLK